MNMTYTKEEQKEHRVALVAALRSGKYRQARNSLNTGNGMCCLGVACDISGLGEWEPTTYGKIRYVLGDNSSINYLTDELKDYFGFTSNKGKYGWHTSLAEKNDSGASFADIADIIESEPEGLVV
jgi:hypothetical protein